MSLFIAHDSVSLVMYHTGDYLCW